MNHSAARVLAVLALALLFIVPAVQASDHADPVFLNDPEANITGLFFFPHGDQMIMVLNVRRSTTKPAPFKLSQYEYVVNFDFHSKVEFDDEHRLRYGGAVPNSEGISPDATITIHLNDDTTIRDKKVTGLQAPETFRWWSGLRDDPFIFPRFFGKNVISMVASIPMTAFPAGQQDFVIWGVTSKNGKQIDHVGRSNRTQLGRFDFLNTLPPKEHVAAIMKQMKKLDPYFKCLRKYKLTTPIANLTMPTLGIRKYDFAPDVMIYSTRYPPGFPNGRRLEDDIVWKTCEFGDCDLYELAFTEGGFPRQTVNDKPLLADFPFMAAPWPDKAELPPPVSFWRVGIWILLALILWHLLWFWFGIWYCRRRRRAA